MGVYFVDSCPSLYPHKAEEREKRETRVEKKRQLRGRGGGERWRESLWFCFLCLRALNYTLKNYSHDLIISQSPHLLKPPLWVIRISTSEFKGNIQFIQLPYWQTHFFLLSCHDAWISITKNLLGEIEHNTFSPNLPIQLWITIITKMATLALKPSGCYGSFLDMNGKTKVWEKHGLSMK